MKDNVIIKLDKVLKDRNYPKYRFAKDSGLDYRIILAWCKNDVKSIKLQTLKIMCGQLGCQISDILEYKE